MSTDPERGRQDAQAWLLGVLFLGVLYLLYWLSTDPVLETGHWLPLR